MEKKMKRVEIVKKFNLEEAMFYKAFRTKMPTDQLDLTHVKTSSGFRSNLVNKASILYRIMIGYYPDHELQDEIARKKNDLCSKSKYACLNKSILSKIILLRNLSTRIDGMWNRRDFLETKYHLELSDRPSLIDTVRIDDMITSLSKKFIKTYKSVVHMLRVKNKFLYEVYGIKHVETEE